jgi:hypothetical protein
MIVNSMKYDTAGNPIFEPPRCDCGLTGGCEKCRPKIFGKKDEWWLIPNRDGTRHPVFDEERFIPIEENAIDKETERKFYEKVAYSEAKRTVIPTEGGQPFRRKADTDSDGTRTVIPTECGYPSRDVRGFFWS